MEPGNQQIQELKASLEKNQRFDAFLGLTLLGGAAALLGGMVWNVLRKRD